MFLCYKSQKINENICQTKKLIINKFMISTICFIDFAKKDY